MSERYERCAHGEQPSRCIYCAREQIERMGGRWVVAMDTIAQLRWLLREARTEVEWWTPDECNATDYETSKLRSWYELRDRIDAALNTAADKSTPRAE